MKRSVSMGVLLLCALLSLTAAGATTDQGAPRGLTAAAGDAKVTLTWQAAAAGSRYNVYRGLSSGNPAAAPIISALTTTAFVDTGLANGTKYYYRVRAVNPNGVLSPFSNETAARPEAPPPPPPSAAPANLNITAGNAFVTLNWDAVSGAAGYRVYRGTSPGGESGTPLSSLSGTTYKNTGLTNGVTYFYKVLAYNVGGNGPYSNEVSAIPIGPPTGLTAAAGDTQVRLSWLASAGAQSYNVYRRVSSTPESDTPIATGVGGLTFLDTGLTNGTIYRYRVRAVRGLTVSGPSNEASAKPLPPPPATAPTPFTAAPGNARVTLTWAPVGGATGYKVFAGTTPGGEGSTPLASQTGTTFRHINLSNGATYFYKVLAFNTGGSGPLSSETSATPLAPPAAPTGVSATAGNGQATLTWMNAANAATYNVYRGTLPGREASVAVGTGIAGPPFIDAALSNGASYYYKVTAINVGGESPRSAETVAYPEGPPLTPDAATIAAFRLLRQATWGPSPADADRVKTIGEAAFLDEQFGAPVSTYPDALFNQPIEAAQERMMQLALTGPDQLRQRAAWALHKIWVVSAVEVDSAPGIVTYHRLLLNGAFGNYRDLMRDVTLNPAMGRYLNMANNRSQAVTGFAPNENYAREIIQLFTLGIPRLNPNGTLLLDASGQQIPVYTEADVKELARIFTGWTYGDGNPATIPNRLRDENFRFPMEAVERYHDMGAKTFLGVAFPPGQTARQDLDRALDTLFNHPNMGPFISRQLILQLVTSNPSPSYVAAIAAVFNDNGSGARGDLAAVIRAILTHPEAHTTTLTSGKLMEPVLFVVSTLRGLNAAVTDHPFMSDRAEAMGQKVFYPPSVFSYFSPGYRVRGTAPPLGGPEFQILTTVTALERANFIGSLVGGKFGQDAVIDATPFLSRASDPAALVDYCNLLFMGGQMSTEERTEIIGAVRVSPTSRLSERVRTAVYLTLTAAQFQVDR